MSYCISGKTKHVRGYRILPRRPDNIYPPADHSSTSEDIAAATSKPCDSSNALEVIRKHRRSRTASLGKRKSVVLLDESGKVLKTFSSQHEASLELGLTPSEVSNAVRGCRLMKVCFVRILILLQKSVVKWYNLCTYSVNLLSSLVAQLGRNRLHIELAPGNVYPAAAQTHAELIPQISSKVSLPMNCQAYICEQRLRAECTTRNVVIRVILLKLFSLSTFFVCIGFKGQCRRKKYPS